MALSTKDIIEAYLLGTKLSKSKAAGLEKLLREDQWNVEARISLLAYYRFKRPPLAVQRPLHDPYCLHVLWLIRNLPEEPAAGCDIAQIDKVIYPEAYEIGRELWLAYVQNEPSNVNVYLNVFAYFQIFESDLAHEILNEALLRFPNHPKLLRHRIWKLCASGKSIDSFREAVELSKNYRAQAGVTDPSMQIEIAKLALALGCLHEAAGHASEVLQPINSGELNSLEFTRAHTLLGLVALRNDDINEAEFHLLESANYPTGIRMLNCGRRDFGLANELVRLGKVKTVEKYLWSCLKEGRVMRTKLLLDILLLKLGQKPKL